MSNTYNQLHITFSHVFFVHKIIHVLTCLPLLYESPKRPVPRFIVRDYWNFNFSWRLFCIEKRGLCAKHPEDPHQGGKVGEQLSVNVDSATWLPRDLPNRASKCKHIPGFLSRVELIYRFERSITISHDPSHLLTNSVLKSIPVIPHDQFMACRFGAG